MAELNAKELATYIQKKYKMDKGKDISPIKLQKSLYFLFAYWGGLVRKSKLFPDAVEEKFDNFSEYLFDEEIQAWVYGPVVPSVYREQNLNSYYKENLFEGREKLKDFVDSILNDLFEVSDFTLVEISHRDKAWINNFDYDEDIHANVISKEEILQEYARK